MHRQHAWFLAGALALVLHARPGMAQGYADEDRDWGVAPTQRLREAPYTAPTPLVISRARLIATRELEALAVPGHPDRPVLVDVAAGDGHATLLGAVWIPGVGRGTSFVDPIQEQF
ncbi:MAG: hypothetical protein FJY55_04240, partial [Betaproteobacteria bacterium]|nr:hypothetical protein [Betaproteobacteria bacterium]